MVQKLTRLTSLALVSILLLIFFVTLASVLHARAAIAGGALQFPTICLEQRHFDAWKSGQFPKQRTTDIVAGKVRAFYLERSGHRRISEWHLRGAFAMLGVWVGYSTQERRRMALIAIASMPRCPFGR